MIATTVTVSALAVAAGLTLWNKARRDHREAMGRRAALLEEAEGLFPGGQAALAPDGFPRFDAPLADGRTLRLEVFADTLVTRRLPQLWLRLSIVAPEPVRPFAIGALARPTGAEFYSIVHELPDWIAPPDGDLPLLVRGGSVSATETARARQTFADLFADPQLKEAALTRRGVSILRQASEGDRAAHLLLRQVKFPVETIPAELIRQALADAARLEGALAPQAATDTHAAP